LVGIAAAAALVFVFRSQLTANAPATTTPAASQAEQTEREKAAPEEGAKQDEVAHVDRTGEDQEPGDSAIDVNDLGAATASPDAPPPVPGQAGAVAHSDPGVDRKDNHPEKVAPDGTLDEDMEKRFADRDKGAAEPAGNEETRPKNVPDRPPQGSVTAAVGAVMGSAKACVAGADDVSRATITFGSSGAVQSVAVSGWASGKPAASCIQNALKGANVGAFSQPTFTFGVTIRP
jgi:hypothetical protein